MKLVYETATCARCFGSGEYPSSAWQGVCLGCNGTGNKLTPAGRRATKRFEAIADEMNVTFADVKVGDRILFTSVTRKWVDVTAIEPDAHNPGYVVFTFAQTSAGQLATKPEFAVRRYDRDVWVRAARDAARLSGAILEGDDAVADVAPQAPKATGSHADCTHERTAKARAACRRARA